MAPFHSWLFILYFGSFATGFSFMAMTLFLWRNQGSAIFREIFLFLLSCLLFNALDLAMMNRGSLFGAAAASMIEAPTAIAALVLRSLQSLFLVRFCDSLSGNRPRPAMALAILVLLASYPAYSLWGMLFPGLAPFDRGWLQNGVTFVNAYTLVRVARMRGSVGDPDLRKGLGLALYIGAAVSVLFGVIDDNFLRLREFDPYLDNIDHHLVLLVWGVVGLAVGSRAFRLRFQKREPAASFEECLIAKGLSAREREIASLMAEGLSNDEIAGRLFISVPTVKTHAFRFFRKLGIRNRVELRYLAKAAVPVPDSGRRA